MTGLRGGQMFYPPLEAAAPRYIETVPRRGFRFIGPVVTTPAALPVSGTGMPMVDHGAEPLESNPEFPITPVVGREAELGQLHQVLEQAFTGQRQLVFVTGEAGIGKTTVVEAFLARLSAEGEVWIGRGQCVEQHGAGEAYLPVLEALGRVARGAGREHLLTVFKQYAPTWLLQMPALLSDGELEAVQRRAQGASRERMLREVCEALEALTTDTLLIVVLEDLHWSDHATLDLLTMLARRPEAARLLVVGTYRPAEVALREHPLAAVKHALQVHGECTEVALEFLSEAAVGEYLRLRFPQQQFPGHFARLLQRMTDGNPLFMLNTLNELTARGVLREEEAGWVVRTSAEEALGGTPESLRQVIAQQVEWLNGEQQRVLEAASVVGVEFSSALVAAGLRGTVEEVERVCEELARRGQFVRGIGAVTFAEGTVAARYEFGHAVYQSVLYEQVSEAQRVRGHRAIGEAAERLWGERAAELAVHFERGQDVPRAVHYRQQAGSNALQQHGYHEVAAHLTLALHLLASLPDTPDRVQQELTLQMTLGVALMGTKGFSAPEVEQAYARARTLCQQLGDTPQLFPALYGLWSFHLTRTELHTARTLGEHLLRLAHASQDTTLLLQAHQVLGLTLFFQGEGVAAHEHLQEALTLYDPQQHRSLVFLYGQDPGVVCLSYATLIPWLLGSSDQALQRSRDGVALARELMHAPSLASALTFTALFHSWRREWHVAQLCADEASTLATEQGLPFWVVQATVRRGWTLVGQGQDEEGSAQIRQSTDTLSAMGATLGRSTYLYMLAEAYGKMSRAEEGLNILAEALEFVNSTGERFYEAELYRLKGELMLAQARVQRLGSSVKRVQSSKWQNPNIQSLAPSTHAEIVCQLKGRSTR